MKMFLKMMGQRAAELPMVMMMIAFAAVACIIDDVNAGPYLPRPDIGYPAGLIPDCPGVMKNATISAPMLEKLQVAIHTYTNGQIHRRSVPIENAWKTVAVDRGIDLKNKKTVLYAVGFLDSSAWPHSLAIGNTYARRGYNVFVTETISFLSYIYPKSVRLTRTIGRKVGEFLIKLYELGLDPDKLELVGVSLGAHVTGHAAKYFYSQTGKKPARITGLDPAGPCYRNLPSTHKLAPTDGHRVDVIHTNIDGFGIAERLGHIDFYVNGGEFQPSDIPYIPCLVICSHLRSVIYWWQSLEHPKKFIGMKCDSVQEARFANCFNNTETNYLGLETNFEKQGVFYLPTHNEFPYYRAKEGLKKDNEIYTSTIRKINSDNGFTV